MDCIFFSLLTYSIHVFNFNQFHSYIFSWNDYLFLTWILVIGASYYAFQSMQVAQRHCLVPQVGLLSLEYFRIWFGNLILNWFKIASNLSQFPILVFHGSYCFYRILLLLLRHFYLILTLLFLFNFF